MKIKAQSLDEYDDEAVKAALRDKVVGEKRSIEIFKAIDTER
ncbi:hypothetical protein FLA4_11410 [Candidatus Rickettsia kotlanii]|nr:hypothetical protein FLA4_11410 [Candidatus Rickettsia kotlanii]BDU61973.1 hypothetical protein HM2_11410 [Candidatus Rickettsia kotlanii]